MKKIIIVVLLITLISGCSIYPNVIKSGIPEDKLWMAIDRGNLEAAKESIEAGADASDFHKREYCERTEHNRKISNTILQALSKGRKRIAEYLISIGANVNYIDKEGESVLQYCAEFDPEFIDDVIMAGADIKYADPSGKTALEYAVLCNVDIAAESSFDILLKQGAIPTKKTLDTILSSLSIEKYGMLNKTLNTLDVDLKDAVYSAFTGGYVTSGVTEQNKNLVLGGISAFGTSSNLSIYNDMIDVQTASELLKSATIYDNKDTAEYLINHYTGLTTEGREDFLYYASSNNDVKLVKMIYENLGGNVALAASHAIKKNNNEVLLFFLDTGLNPESLVLEGTLLASCCFYENYDAAKILLERGAGADDNALTIACKNGSLDLAELLIEYGANADCKNIYEDGSGGNSALMQSIYAGELECVKLLLENGADKNYQYNGKNAVEYSRIAGSDRIYEYILNI